MPLKSSRCWQSQRGQDGAGISDADKGTGDADQDGVPDYLDAISSGGGGGGGGCITGTRDTVDPLLLLMLSVLGLVKRRFGLM